MAKLDPKTVDMFYFTGDKHTTPNCPVLLRPNFNPSSGAQSYQSSGPQCSSNCAYNIPFFLKNLGPKFSEYSVNAHEARPGHHTQVRLHRFLTLWGFTGYMIHGYIRTIVELMLNYISWHLAEE